MKVAVILDPIDKLNHYKDTSIAMCKTMAERGWHIDCIEHSTLAIRDKRPCAVARQLTLGQSHDTYDIGTEERVSLTDYQLILMRQDPPCDHSYITNTMIIRMAEAQGAVVANRCDKLLTLNEKLFATEFSDLCPATIVSRNISELDSWYRQHRDVVIKPLYGMGGQGIFHIKPDDDNAGSIFETVTKYGSQSAMLQEYIPEVIHGDKRILLIDGKPFEYALARIPKEHEARANLAAGGTGKTQALSTRDLHIANTIGQKIKGTGLYFVGLDVIGDYLTEINITSPTGVMELIRDTGINPLVDLFDCLAREVACKMGR